MKLRTDKPSIVAWGTKRGKKQFFSFGIEGVTNITELDKYFDDLHDSIPFIKVRFNIYSLDTTQDFTIATIYRTTLDHAGRDGYFALSLLIPQGYSMDIAYMLPVLDNLSLLYRKEYIQTNSQGRLLDTVMENVSLFEKVADVSLSSRMLIGSVDTQIANSVINFKNEEELRNIFGLIAGNIEYKNLKVYVLPTPTPGLTFSLPIVALDTILDLGKSIIPPEPPKQTKQENNPPNNYADNFLKEKRALEYYKQGENSLTNKESKEHSIVETNKELSDTEIETTPDSKTPKIEPKKKFNFKELFKKKIFLYSALGGLVCIVLAVVLIFVLNRKPSKRLTEREIKKDSIHVFREFDIDSLNSIYKKYKNKFKENQTDTARISAFLSSIDSLAQVKIPDKYNEIYKFLQGTGFETTQAKEYQKFVSVANNYKKFDSTKAISFEVFLKLCNHYEQYNTIITTNADCEDVKKWAKVNVPGFRKKDSVSGYNYKREGMEAPYFKYPFSQNQMDKIGEMAKNVADKYVPKQCHPF